MYDQYASRSGLVLGASAQLGSEPNLQRNPGSGRWRLRPIGFSSIWIAACRGELGHVDLGSAANRFGRHLGVNGRQTTDNGGSWGTTRDTLESAFNQDR